MALETEIREWKTEGSKQEGQKAAPLSLESHHFAKRSPLRQRSGKGRTKTGGAQRRWGSGEHCNAGAKKKGVKEDKTDATTLRTRKDKVNQTRSRQVKEPRTDTTSTSQNGVCMTWDDTRPANTEEEEERTGIVR